MRIIAQCLSKIKYVEKMMPYRDDIYLFRVSNEIKRMDIKFKDEKVVEEGLYKLDKNYNLTLIKQFRKSNICLFEDKIYYSEKINKTETQVVVFDLSENTFRFFDKNMNQVGGLNRSLFITYSPPTEGKPLNYLKFENRSFIRIKHFQAIERYIDQYLIYLDKGEYIVAYDYQDQERWRINLFKDLKGYEYPIYFFKKTIIDEKYLIMCENEKDNAMICISIEDGKIMWFKDKTNYTCYQSYDNKFYALGSDYAAELNVFDGSVIVEKSLAKEYDKYNIHYLIDYCYAFKDYIFRFPLGARPYVVVLNRHTLDFVAYVDLSQDGEELPLQFNPVFREFPYNFDYKDGILSVVDYGGTMRIFKLNLNEVIE